MKVPRLRVHADYYLFNHTVNSLKATIEELESKVDNLTTEKRLVERKVANLEEDLDSYKKKNEMTVSEREKTYEKE